MQRFEAALNRAVATLLNARTKEGIWRGRLASSALSTATAVSALELVRRNIVAEGGSLSFDVSLIERGLDWLARNVNADGGWGDTTLSFSNLSTTVLCWSAFHIVEDGKRKYPEVIQRAEKWIIQRAGRKEPYILAPSIIARYGKDRTFSAPILMMCALAGRLGERDSAWEWVPQLPFEIAAFPRKLFPVLKVPVVSYALPALVAIGIVKHHHSPSSNTVLKVLRNILEDRTLNVVDEIQPPNGGFLEAIPLTSFVTMALSGCGKHHHPVVKRAVEFIKNSAREDGSWAIDTDLAHWLTSLSVNALAGVLGRKDSFINADDATRLLQWLLKCQYKEAHPYTGAPPGGWAWTDLPGGVPDADDTAGALVALSKLINLSNAHNISTGSAGGSLSGSGNFTLIKSVAAGINWLLNLQNSDGGIPTFCRGWGHLPFDRSGSDLTAHAIRAWMSWINIIPRSDGDKVIRSANKALEFVVRSQNPDGSWQPLWFGNQYEYNERNLTYGTSRVLLAISALQNLSSNKTADAITKGLNWLIKAQNQDGSWGGFIGSPASVEETAFAVEAIATALTTPSAATTALREQLRNACLSGVNWLIDKIEQDSWRNPSPIGFYFARLWYYEELYPIIFTVSALNRVRHFLAYSKKL